MCIPEGMVFACTIHPQRRYVKFKKKNWKTQRLRVVSEVEGSAALYQIV